MYTKMAKVYDDVAQYFALDKNKYSLDEFFTDVKIFIKNFIVSVAS